jgi:hypothetical protein
LVGIQAFPHKAPLSQLCAVSSPGTRILSAIEILQQLG